MYGTIIFYKLHHGETKPPEPHTLEVANESVDSQVSRKSKSYMFAYFCIDICSERQTKPRTRAWA
jgi:hypothetical protein